LNELTEICSIKVTELPEATLVSLCGELTINTANRFKGLLAELVMKGRTCFIIDLTEVEFIDSTGFAVLVALKKALSRKANQIKLVMTDPLLIHKYETIALDKIFGRPFTSWREAEYMIAC
jgi:anti-anti-sigma factor